MGIYPFNHGYFESTGLMKCTYIQTSKDHYEVAVEGEDEATIVFYVGNDQWQVTRPHKDAVVVTDRGTAATAVATVMKDE